MDEMKIVRMFQNSIAQMRSSIASRLGVMYDGLRKIQAILGYKTQLGYEDYLAMYSRQDVAGRIVDMPPQETWRNPPTLVAKDKATADADFFKDWENLAERLNIWRWFEKVDRLSGIGQFGVLFIGTAGNLESPVGDNMAAEDILYLMAYPEGRIEILDLDMDTASPRFGLPILYKIKLVEFQDPNGTRKLSDGQGMIEEKIHWSRVLHVAEDALSDRVHGRPRLMRVFDRMWDMLKVTGGSAEMFWQNVAQIFHVNLNPELDYSDSDLADLDDKFKEMLQGIRRVVQTEGIESIKPLQGKTPDPRGITSVLKTLIASAAEIPQRILFGSEQGEMASTQDKSEWYGRIEARRQRHAEPEILMAFVMRLASWGVLVLPEGGVATEWPSLFEETPAEKAQAARTLAMTAAKMDPERPDRIIGIREIREAAGLPAQIPADVQADVDALDEKKEEDAVKAKEEMEAAAALVLPVPPLGGPGLQVASGS